MSVRLDERQRPKPDPLVVDEAALEDNEQTWFQPVEAGIRHFWRVEEDKRGRAVVFTYELDAVSCRYVPTGIHRETMRLSAPFPIEVDVASLDRWRRLRLT